jgi:transposase
MHPDDKLRRTWAFVMTLCFSRHQYVEFVWDQSAATWLGCHRRAFEWFGAVPLRVTIDNAKCAITKACAKDPTVQRAYAECAEGYGFKIDPCPPYDPQKKGIVESARVRHQMTQVVDSYRARFKLATTKGSTGRLESVF